MATNKQHKFDYDVLVIGAGPGGYVAAIRAAQLGLKTACIDKRESLGGTCLNVGCIPSKSLLHASEHYDQIMSGSLEKFGIQKAAASLDLAAMMNEKVKAVGELTTGIAHLFKKNKVDRITGQASFVKPNHVRIGTQTISAKDIIIATGSSPMTLPNITLNNKTIVDSTGALSLEEVPKHLVVVGGGVIGLELGSVWKRLGAKVTVIEFSDSILNGMDKDLCDAALKTFTIQGIEFELGHEVTSVEENKSGQIIRFKSRESGEEKSIDVSHVLVATGRRPNTDGLGLNTLRIEQDERGFVLVDENFKTNVANVWAIGDVTPGLMLAHRAEDEGIAVSELVAGKVGLVNHQVIPNIVYTHPEVASVGMSESEALKYFDVKKGSFPFAANSRAKANRDTQGFVKVIANADDDTVLGVHIIGAQAGNMIAQVVQAMEFGATSEDIAYTCHAHPTHAEALKEAAMSVLGKPIHM